MYAKDTEKTVTAVLVGVETHLGDPDEWGKGQVD